MAMRGSKPSVAVNAIRYGVLKTQIRGEIITASLDPSVEIIHANRHNRDPLVNDLIEPLRPVVDRKLSEFAITHTFTLDDFT